MSLIVRCSLFSCFRRADFARYQLGRQTSISVPISVWLDRYDGASEAPRYISHIFLVYLRAHRWKTAPPVLCVDTTFSVCGVRWRIAFFFPIVYYLGRAFRCGFLYFYWIDAVRCKFVSPYCTILPIDAFQSSNITLFIISYPRRYDV